MLRADLKREPYVLDILPGITFTVRPPHSAMFETARVFARRQLQALDDMPELLVSVGWDLDALPDLTDPDAREGAFHALYKARVARLAILSWQGVFIGKGKEPAPLNDDTVAFVMAYMIEVAEIFWLKYSGVLERLDAAKKEPGPGSDGTSETGPTTAARVAKKEARVPKTSPAVPGKKNRAARRASAKKARAKKPPAKSAPTKKTRRSP